MAVANGVVGRVVGVFGWDTPALAMEAAASAAAIEAADTPVDGAADATDRRVGVTGWAAAAAAAVPAAAAAALTVLPLRRGEVGAGPKTFLGDPLTPLPLPLRLPPVGVDSILSMYDDTSAAAGDGAVRGLPMDPPTPLTIREGLPPLLARFDRVFCGPGPAPTSAQSMSVDRLYFQRPVCMQEGRMIT